MSELTDLRPDREGFVYFFIMTVSTAVVSVIFFIFLSGGRGPIEQLFYYYLLFLLSVPIVISMIIGSLIYLVVSTLMYLPAQYALYGFFLIFGVCAVIHIFMMSILIASARKEFERYRTTAVSYVGLMFLFSFLLWFLGFFGL